MNLTLREVLDRYGPALAVIVVLVLLVVLTPGGRVGEQGLTAAGDAGAAGSSAAPGGGDAGGAPGGTGTATGPGLAGSSGAGGSGDGTPAGTAGAGGGATSVSGSGPADPGAPGAPGPGGGPEAGAPAGTACREDGAMPSFSFYAPSCVPVFTGDNGGATSKGVTADEIRLVYYIPNASAAETATLQAIGADDPLPQIKEVIESLVRYFNLHYETYGRQVKVTFFESRAAVDDEAALRADAVKIDNDLKPFAVLAAGPITATELAARGIICVCTVSQASGYYQDNAPYVYSILPELEEYYQQMAEYQGKRLAGRPARFAGNLPAGINTRPRSFGLIYIEGDGNQIDPRAKEGVAFYEQELARYGVELAAKVAYTYDPAQGQSQATNLIAKMRDAGVSNLACLCDPIYPIFLTKAATQQQYYPEWFITGTALTDTTFFGRTYDQAQWAHAFGISPLPVPATNVSDTAPFQEYFHGRGGGEPGDEGTQIQVRESGLSLVATGIQVAGPRLSPQSFARGLWDTPAMGGPVGTVLTKLTPESYSVIKNFTEVYWDTTGRGRDEVGNEGVGRVMKTDGANRYQAGQWPVGEPKAFEGQGAVFSVDGKLYVEHAADGHAHRPEERCRSCR